MQLWNDYEGRVIAEAYPLEKLLSPEGRSAFFTTSNGTGTPSVIRLIEAHFDEAEILSRWKQVGQIQQPNLIALRNCGETQLDGTALVYAVMEPTDASLGDILKERPLTVDETRQIATSLVAALDALHTHNLVHEHIEAENVFAAGEVIKLRSDCVREAPEGAEGVALKARDVHALGTLLLQALTLQKTLPSIPLAAPFHDIVRHATSGTWGLKEIAAALNPPAPVAPGPVRVPAYVPLAPSEAASSAAASSVAASSMAAASESVARPAAAAASSAASQQRAKFQIHEAASSPKIKDRIMNPVVAEERRGARFWAAVGAGILTLILLLWHFLGGSPATQSQKSGADASTLAAMPDAAPAGVAAKPSAGAGVRPAAVAAPAESRPPTRSAGDARGEWRVIAFTYNRQDQAQQKVASLAKLHPELHPEVFAPKGRGPYLVSLGGPMSRERADELRRHARGAGLPRDTYIQNYLR